MPEDQQLPRIRCNALPAYDIPLDAPTRLFPRQRSYRQIFQLSTYERYHAVVTWSFFGDQIEHLKLGDTH
jgi:hypothetical protein